MDWQNERYVRIYTRDTRTLKLIGWEGRAVLWEVLRKCDRAGVMDGVRTPEDLALMIDIPVETVRVALGRMVSTGAVEITDMGLVVPNYIAAQEAKQTDRQRQRESRARRAATARAVTKRDSIASHSVTEPVDFVTSGHTASHAVTSCHSVPSLAVPSLAVPSLADPTYSPPQGTTQKVFDHWAKEHNHPHAKLDPKRRKRIDARLREGFSADQLCQAISGARKDDWLMGRDPRSSKVYDGIQTILRDADQVERLIELHHSKKPAPPPKGVGRARQQALRDACIADAEARAVEFEKRVRGPIEAEERTCGECSLDTVDWVTGT
jgi:hypothetical protein